MCLLTYQKEPIILEEDLIVYKHITNYNNKLVSPYHYKYYQTNSWGYSYEYFIWKLNKLYKTEIKTDWSRCPMDNIVSQAYDILDANLFSYGEGFHSALNPERIGRVYDTYKCIIPKGSEIFKDITDLVVSNQIIILEKLFAANFIQSVW